MKYLALALALLFACHAPSERDRVAAAQQVTELYAASVFDVWGLDVRAEGDDCRVLTVYAGAVLDDAMVERLHYGHGSYGVTPGGFQWFSRRNGFRGIVYVDAVDRVWASGDLRRREGDGPIDVGNGVRRLRAREVDMWLGRIAVCG